MIRKGVLINLIQLAQILALVGITVVVTRVTGAEGRGIYTLVSAVAMIAATIAGFGISWAAIYYIGKAAFPLAGVVSTLLTTSLAAAGISTVGLLAAYLVLQHSYFHEVSLDQALIMVALAAFLQLAATTASIVLGLNRPLEYAGLATYQVVVPLVLQLALAAAGALDATTALIAFTLGPAVSAGYGLWLVSREAPLRLGFDSTIVRSLSKFGLLGYAANLMTLLTYRLGFLIVNGLRGAASLGYFSVATAMAETLTYGANGLALVLFPHVSSAERSESDRVAPIMCRNVIFLTLAGAVAMFAVSGPLIMVVFGPAMNPALTPLWLMLPGIVGMAAAKVISSYLNGIGKPAYNTWIAAGSVLLTAVLDFALIPRYGINGAAVAGTVVYMGMAAASIWLLKVESGASVLDITVIRGEDLARYRRVLDSTINRLVAPSPQRP
jgi:O-antigen/teichoic acid export membrane protein